jgi:predicted  nucleic acid-binding Zn-ribbon protein
MYETRNQLRRIRDRIKSYDENDMFAKAEYEKNSNPQVDWLIDFEGVADEVNEIQREVDELSYKNRGDESDKKRREELERLQGVQTRLARELLKKYKEKFPND